MKSAKNLYRRIKSNFFVIVGVIVIWRGIWIILDAIDATLFGGNDLVFAVATIMVGFFMLYLHDHKYDNLDHF